jgi:hypothetical protein
MMLLVLLIIQRHKALGMFWNSIKRETCVTLKNADHVLWILRIKQTLVVFAWLKSKFLKRLYDMLPLWQAKSQLDFVSTNEFICKTETGMTQRFLSKK